MGKLTVEFRVSDEPARPENIIIADPHKPLSSILLPILGQLMGRLSWPTETDYEADMAMALERIRYIHRSN